MIDRSRGLVLAMMHNEVLLIVIKALFFSVENLGCGMGECGKGEKELVKVGKSGIFLNMGKGGKEWVKVGRS